MTIIDQLNQTVTPLILEKRNNDSVAYASLLEQFYALLITRLAQPVVYSQLLGSDKSTLIESNSSQNLFTQLWPLPDQRQLLIDELAAIHHIDKQNTEQLLIDAAQLTYQELKSLAKGQFLPVFLQAQQSSVRQYLPVWAEEVILPISKIEELSDKIEEPSDSAVLTATNDDDDDYNDNENENLESINNNEDPVITEPQPLLPEVIATNAVSAESISLTKSTDAIHANPSDYYDDQPSKNRLKAPISNRKNNLLIQVLLLIGVLAAIGIAWALVIKPNYTAAPEADIAVPVAADADPISEPIAKTVKPAELVIGIDDNGNLYSCTATVGNKDLQSAISNALDISFAQQAALCELTVQQGMATNLAAIELEKLPNMLTLLRSVPFARLQLQNDIINLAAPDEDMLQRLVTDMRTLLPEMSITSAAPLPLTDPNAINNNEIAAMNPGAEFENGSSSTNGDYDSRNSDSIGTNDFEANNGNIDRDNNKPYQQSDDDTNDSVVPTPSRRNNVDNNFSNNTNNRNNNLPASTSAGSISASEVDDLANSTIVAEKLRNERPVDKNLTQSQ